jgi:hypothetical protein
MDKVVEVTLYEDGGIDVTPHSKFNAYQAAILLMSIQNYIDKTMAASPCEIKSTAELFLHFVTAIKNHTEEMEKKG